MPDAPSILIGATNSSGNAGSASSNSQATQAAFNDALAAAREDPGSSRPGLVSSDAGRDGWDTVSDSIDVATGTAEVLAGAASIWGSGVASALGPAGWPLSAGLGLLGSWAIVQGADTALTGIAELLSGEDIDTQTVQLLQAAGLSHEAAQDVDAFLGVALSLGVGAAAKTGKLTAALSAREWAAVNTARKTQAEAYDAVVSATETFNASDVSGRSFAETVKALGRKGALDEAKAALQEAAQALKAARLRASVADTANDRIASDVTKVAFGSAAGHLINGIATHLPTDGAILPTPEPPSQPTSGASPARSTSSPATSAPQPEPTGGEEIDEDSAWFGDTYTYSTDTVRDWVPEDAKPDRP